MKRSILDLSIVLIIAGCQTKNSKLSADHSMTQETIAPVNALTVSELLRVAEENVGKEVVLTGTVTHTCKHSGKRCFVTDSTGTQSIRVEATGQINGFNRELAGSDITVNGVLREKRLDESFLSEWESKNLAEQEKAEEESGHCSAELDNFREMREWMKANNKDYYSVFYVDGTTYDLVE